MNHKGTGGKKGRSGRRSLSVEVERCKIRDAAWRVTGEYIESTQPLEKRAQVAVGVVKADMAKPIVIDQSKNTYITSIQVENMKPEELVDIAMGRQVER